MISYLEIERARIALRKKRIKTFFIIIACVIYIILIFALYGLYMYYVVLTFKQEFLSKEPEVVSQTIETTSLQTSTSMSTTKVTTITTASTTTTTVTTASPETTIPEEDNPDWDGPVLNFFNGNIDGPSGSETFYNLNMDGVISIMRDLGYDEANYPYWEREDGVKMFGPYVMCAADLSFRPKGTILESSLGMAIVCDTGSFTEEDPNRLDIAVTW